MYQNLKHVGMWMQNSLMRLMRLKDYEIRITTHSRNHYLHGVPVNEINQ